MPEAAKKDKEKGDGKVEKDAKKEAEAPPKKAPEPRGGMDDLRRIVAMIERAVETDQPRIIGRALRHNGPLRHGITKAILTAAVEKYIPEGASRVALLEQVSPLPDAPPPAPAAAPAAATSPAVAGKRSGEEELAAGIEAMDVEDSKSGEEKKAEEEEAPRTTVIPEVEAYLSLLVVTTLLRQGPAMATPAAAAAASLFTALGAQNRRSLDLLRARASHYLSLSVERLDAAAAAKSGAGRPSSSASLASLRPTLLAAHRTACLQHDDVGQATLLNLVLRSLLLENQVDQAYKLVSKTNFPEKASNNQFCRYLYYTGRIAALQLEYGDAYDKLKSALRKAPQGPGAVGFRRAVQKLSVIVSLLMGEVPERSLFNHPDFKKALQPYLALTVAVREGNLAAFNAAVAAHKGQFREDAMLSLVVRLSHSVIKTGLRRINLSYSRISLADIQAKLSLDSAASAESVCAKAIRDGVIDAVLDHERAELSCKERTNVYATNEPQRNFHQRVEFCLAVRNEAVKAMRYPADAFKPKPKKPDGGGEEKTAEELAKEIEEELEEEDDI